MKKLRNDSKEGLLYLYRGTQFDWSNGQIVEVPDDFKDVITKQLERLNVVEEKVVTPVVVSKPSSVVGPVFWEREELEKKNMIELREIGYNLGVKDNKKSGLIEKILKAQGG